MSNKVILTENVVKQMLMESLSSYCQENNILLEDVDEGFLKGLWGIFKNGLGRMKGDYDSANGRPVKPLKYPWKDNNGNPVNDYSYYSGYQPYGFQDDEPNPTQPEQTPEPQPTWPQPEPISNPEGSDNYTAPVPEPIKEPENLMPKQNQGTPQTQQMRNIPTSRSIASSFGKSLISTKQQLKQSGKQIPYASVEQAVNMLLNNIKANPRKFGITIQTNNKQPKQQRVRNGKVGALNTMGSGINNQQANYQRNHELNQDMRGKSIFNEEKLRKMIAKSLNESFKQLKGELKDKKKINESLGEPLFSNMPSSKQYEKFRTKDVSYDEFEQLLESKEVTDIIRKYGFSLFCGPKHFQIFAPVSNNENDVKMRLQQCLNEIDIATNIYLKASWSGNVGQFADKITYNSDWIQNIQHILDHETQYDFQDWYGGRSILRNLQNKNYEKIISKTFNHYEWCIKDYSMSTDKKIQDHWDDMISHLNDYLTKEYQGKYIAKHVVGKSQSDSRQSDAIIIYAKPFKPENQIVYAKLSQNKFGDCTGEICKPGCGRHGVTLNLDNWEDELISLFSPYLKH